jgi:tetratricopeptide (TPR) repeat protein
MTPRGWIAISLLAAAATQVLPALALPAQSLDRTRSMAETQHEIVMVLLQKKDFPRAAAEANKIFVMKWPDDQEPMLLQELLFFADQFLHQGQPALGVQLLENNSKNFKAVRSRISICKEKGYLYKEMNENDKALESFREAQRLERNGS